MVLRKYYTVFGNIGMIDNIVMAEPRDFSRDINAAYKKYICMALTNHEMCSRFDDFVIPITKTGGVLDF